MPSRREFLGGATILAGLAAASSLRAGAPEIESRSPSGARARVLGTVQDGGLPQLGCERACCVAARRDPSRARRVASIGVSSREAGSVILVDATPDLRSQVAELRDASGIAATPGLPVDAILLTHAHIGHYTGLMYLGRESMAARAVPVLATPGMVAFLRANKPWSRLVEWGHVSLEAIEPGSPRRIAPGIEAEAMRVPHRNEDADTVAYFLTGPAKRLLYVPDTDAWEKWPRPLASILADVDIALLDGTFFGPGEIPGRDASQVPHPLMRSTIDLLARRGAAGRCRVLFTHLNHSNPALDPSSPEAAAIVAAGLSVAEEGMELAL